MKSTVNSRVKLLRTSLRLTQNEFAAELGISPSTISKIEMGENPSPGTIDAIISTYSVPDDWLTDGKGDLKYSRPSGQKFDPATDTLYKELKEQITFYRNLLTQMAGGKSFRTALDRTGLYKKRLSRAAA